MNRHASPLQPENGALTRTRQRYHGKGKAMKTRTQLLAGAGMLAAGIALAATVSADGGKPDKSGYGDGCEYWLAGYQCEGTPGVGSPVPVEPTPTATIAPVETVVVVVVSTPTSEVDTITVLPSTGSGSTAGGR